MQALDNPVWHSLKSRHASLARSQGGVARYPADVAPFVAVGSPDAGVSEDLELLVAPGESVLFLGPVAGLPPDWHIDGPTYIAQMTRQGRLAPVAGPTIIELGEAQLPDVLALTARVYPHYFRPRTPLMGRYIGIYDGPVLAAMAGERMGFDGHQEISAICTHPDYTGRGLAQRLLVELSNAALAAGKLPFLHVAHDNVRARQLYERLGYLHRTDIALWSVRRPLYPGGNTAP